MELRSKLELIKQNEMRTLTSQVNLGSNFYCQAKVKDTSKVIIEVALGFLVEFTIGEALEFIEVKERHLNRCALTT